MRTFSELSLTHSQLALQRHGGVDALAQRRHALLHRTHLHVDQTAAGVALGRPRFPIFRRRHPAFLHPFELDCRANTNTREVIMTAQIPTTVPLSGNCIHRRRLKCSFVEFFFFFFTNNPVVFLIIPGLSHRTEREGNKPYASSNIFPAIFHISFRTIV